MQLSPEGLTALYNAPLSATFQADDLRNQLMTSGQLANDAAGIKNLYDSQNNPGLVEQTRLENQSKQARLPGELATSRSAQLKAERDAAGQGDAISAAKMKFIKEASDHDVSILENQAQKMAYSPDPKIRAQGQMLMSMHRDVLKAREQEKYKMDRQVGLARVAGDEARKTQREGVELGRYARGGGGSGGLQGVRDSLKTGKVGFEKAAVAVSAAAQEAYRSGDVETGDALMEEANGYMQQFIQGRQAGAQAGQVGKPNIEQLTGGSVPTNRPIAPVPLQRATGSSPAAAPKAVLPQGTKDNGDGTFTLPDGRRVRPKQQ
jgi:hypothetical protein